MGITLYPVSIFYLQYLRVAQRKNEMYKMFNSLSPVRVMILGVNVTCLKNVSNVRCSKEFIQPVGVPCAK